MTTTHSSKKGQLAMLQFYKIIIAPGDAERREIAKGNENMIPEDLNLVKIHQDTAEALRSRVELEAVTEVSRKVEAASQARIKTYPVNFEFDLLMRYYAELIYVLGTEGDSRLAAEIVSEYIFKLLDKIISRDARGEAWDDLQQQQPVGQLAFIRRKRQQNQRKNAIKSLFRLLNSRLLEAMQTVNPVVYKQAIPTPSKKALKIILNRAASDARAILKTLGKKQRRRIASILQHIIQPLAENVLSSLKTRKMSGMMFAQLSELRNHFIKKAAKLSVVPSLSSKSKTTRNKMLVRLSYNPKTQLGTVLRLRAQLGHVFQLRFKPIGVNGKGGGHHKEEEEEEEEEEEADATATIYHLPAEILYDIVRIITKINPTKEDTKTLFSAAASTFMIRQIIEDVGFENMMSRRVLGIQHSRLREERRLGLEPNVAERYKGVLAGLRFKKKNIKLLQELADRNADIYDVEKSEAYLPFIPLRSNEELDVLQKNTTEEEEEQPESSKKRLRLARRISAWPWWYFRLLSNHLSLESVTRPFGPKSDGFSASVVHHSMWGDMGLRGHTDAEPNTPIYVNRSPGFLINIARNPSAASVARWQKWSAGADLMVIPMKKLVKRAWVYSKNAFKDGGTTEGSTHLTISVAESMPRPVKASYRKEVVILTKLSQKEMPANLIFKYEVKKRGETEFKKKKLIFDLRLTLEIQHAYLGNSMVQFLNHSLQPRPYLQVEKLSLQHVHFKNPASGLDLSGIAKNLHEFRFGPSNLNKVPKLFCPSLLYRLRLLAAPKTLLSWDLRPRVNPATCFSYLNSLYIDGDIKIWEYPLLGKIGNFPNLTSIVLNHFSGNDEDLLRLAKALQNIKSEVTVMVSPDHVYNSNVLIVDHGFNTPVNTVVIGNVSFTLFSRITEKDDSQLHFHLP